MKHFFILLLGMGISTCSFGWGSLPEIQADSTAPRIDSLPANSLTKESIGLGQDTTLAGSLETAPELPIGIAAPSRPASSLITSNINSYVAGFITNYYNDNTRHLEIIKSKSKPYFHLIDHVFKQYGIPEEMKYLAVIESGLNTNAVSRVGAVGAWQFMAGTARLMGLRVQHYHDDRRNLFKSTLAAALYLNQLHSILNDWLLVVAAYNCGPGGVLRAIKASGSTNFWNLQDYLPTESKGQVLKFLATAYLMDRFPVFFGLDNKVPDPSLIVENITDIYQPAISPDLVSENITVGYSLPVIAQFTSMDINVLKKDNPDFNHPQQGKEFSCTIWLPADKMKVFLADQETIMKESRKAILENDQLVATYPPVVQDSTLLEKANKFHYIVHHSYRRKPIYRHRVLRRRKVYSKK